MEGMHSIGTHSIPRRILCRRFEQKATVDGYHHFVKYYKLERILRLPANANHFCQNNSPQVNYYWIKIKFSTHSGTQRAGNSPNIFRAVDSRNCKSTF